ncbi:hypothetical protein Aduo_009693 [Ancylostoma duodenale]
MSNHILLSSIVSTALIFTALTVICISEKLKKGVLKKDSDVTALKLSKDKRGMPLAAGSKRNVKPASGSESTEKPPGQKESQSNEGRPASTDDSFERLQPRVATAKRYREIANRRIGGRPKEYETLEGMFTEEFEEDAKAKVH